MPPAAPAISVALCTYNGAAFLDEQLRSIAAQTLLPAELVVSDDGSTDRTAEIVANFARTATFPVRFVRQPVNLGVSQNFSAALGLCQGEIAALCDQDDVWLPDKLLAAAEFFAAHPEDWAVFSDATAVDQSLRPLPEPSSLWRRLGHDDRLLARIADPATSLQTLSRAFYVTGATLLVRRELLRLALPIPDPLPGTMLHDGWLALAAAAVGRIGFLAHPTILYRQHGAQQVGLVRPPAARRTLRPPRQWYRATAADVQRTHDLLAPRLAGQTAPDRLDDLRRRAEHFRMRGQTPPPARWRRVGPVVREWRRGGYREYARYPWAEMWRDLLF